MRMLSHRCLPYPMKSSHALQFSSLTLRPPEPRAAYISSLNSTSSSPKTHVSCSTSSLASTGASTINMPSTTLGFASSPLKTFRRGVMKQLSLDSSTTASSSSDRGSSGPLSSLDYDIKRLQAFDAYVAELSKDPIEDPEAGETKGLATLGVPSGGGGASLLRCAALVAQATKYPDADVEAVVEAVNKLAEEVQELLGDNERYPMRVMKAIIHVMYEKHGYHGNTVDFYDDDNSYINQVIARKTGLPITLSIVFMEVAHRVGLPMVGVNLPGHFMIRPFVEDMEVLVDAFSGEIIFRNDAEEKLADVFGGPVRLDPAVLRSSKGVPTRRILQRMLNNIKQLYVIAGGPQQATAALRIIRLMRATKPDYPPDLRDEGLVLYALERYEEAAEALTRYLEVEPSGDDAMRCFTLLEGCRAIIKQSKSKQQ